MSPFDAAWSIIKAPIYEQDDDMPTQYGHHYEMLPHLDKMGGFMWQSEDGMARGTVRPDYFLNSLLINNFEMAEPRRGQGNSRRYLQDMIDEAHAHFDHELQGTHVTNVEPHTAGYWNKLVDEGMIDGAHERPYVRQNNAGDKHYLYAYNPHDMDYWRHELSDDYADYHGLDKEAYIDRILARGEYR